MEYSSSKEFDIFKSDVCHQLKRSGSDLAFMKIILQEHRIEENWNSSKIERALYYYSMIQYFCRKHDVNGSDLFPELKKVKLPVMLVPTGAYLTDRLNKDEQFTCCKKMVENAIPEFAAHNIAEGDLYDVA